MYETYSEMQHRTLCENNSSLANNIINPQCSDGKKENEVIISYDGKYGEKVILWLCAKCTEVIKKDCKRHGYGINVKEMKKK